jgi:hypothetical protein
MFHHPTTRQQRLRRGAIVMLPAVAVAMAAVVVPASQVQAQAPPPPTTFGYTGAAQTWTVPAGVTQATFDVYGAVGGDLRPDFTRGGLGGRATATLLVSPGDTITIVVGGAGEDVDTCQNRPPNGGFNGGGDGGDAVCDGAAGGGASDVRIGGTGLIDRRLVAGGGGGASTAQSQCGRHGGGAGGGLSGGDGLCGGGEGGNQDGSRGSGLLGQGSAGGDGRPGFILGGGGGGGGYYGGAGGANGDGSASVGGGGGSGFGPSGTVFETGVRDGNGQVIVTPLPSPLEQLRQLGAAVQGAGRAGRTLALIVRAAVGAVEAGQTDAACGVLRSFIVTVRLLGLAGQLTPAQATQFTASAITIRAGLGCS